VPRLYKAVRPGARYFNSLHLLKDGEGDRSVDLHQVRADGGPGRGKEEVLQVMDDLRAADVDFMTIGQYLQPTPAHARSRVTSRPTSSNSMRGRPGPRAS
jgi:lipoic acid synthetase